MPTVAGTGIEAQAVSKRAASFGATLGRIESEGEKSVLRAGDEFA